jgi:uncharacterized protein (TIGR02266 family)
MPLTNMSQSDRRTGDRIPVQMWVEESGPDGMYFQRAANLSEGGIFLEKTIPHPVGTQVTLQFNLPDQAGPIRVQGEIVNAKAVDGELGMGLKFVDLPPDVAARIRRFVSDKKK